MGNLQVSQQIEPFLWFDNNAEEAINKYVSLFDNSKILSISRYGKEGPGPEGSVMTVSFELNGLRFGAINGGPQFKFTEAISLMVHCKDQAEVDKYWDAFLSDGGQTQACGWLKDKYGLSWQIIPNVFLELLQSGEAEKVSRMMKAMMSMIKLDVQALTDAYGGK